MKFGFHSAPFSQSTGHGSSSEASLFGHINWSLAQSQQQSSMGLSQSFPPIRSGKARPKTGFHFNVQKRPVVGSSGAYFPKKPHLQSKTEAHKGSRKSSGGGVSASSINSRKVSWVMTFLMCSSPNFITIFFFCCAGWYTSPVSISVDEHYFQKV